MSWVGPDSPAHPIFIGFGIAAASLWKAGTPCESRPNKLGPSPAFLAFRVLGMVV
jgi:hypothetical protein